MPVARGVDKAGCFYQWGGRGKRYYYKAGNAIDREKAKAKAALQGRAAYANGYRGSR